MLLRVLQWDVVEQNGLALNFWLKIKTAGPGHSVNIRLAKMRHGDAFEGYECFDPREIGDGSKVRTELNQKLYVSIFVSSVKSRF